MKRYARILVTARRGDRPPYSYVAHERVRESKSQDIVYREAWDIMKHETRSQARPSFSIEVGDDWTLVRVGICRFYVYAEGITA